MSRGIGARTRRQVLERDEYRCQKCGRQIGWEGSITASYSIQHRLARGMGGSDLDDINAPGNLIVLCGHATERFRCHAWAERRSWEAFNEGFVLRHPMVPIEWPVRTYRGWLLLDNFGGWQRIPEPDPWNTEHRTDTPPF